MKKFLTTPLHPAVLAAPQGGTRGDCFRQLYILYLDAFLLHFIISDFPEQQGVSVKGINAHLNAL